MSSPPLAGQTSSPQTWLLVVTGLGVGGAEKLVIKLARGIQSRGHKVIVAALNNDRQVLDFVDVSDLDIRQLKIDFSIGSMIRGFRHLSQIIRDESVTLIHAHLFHAALISLLAKALRPSLKIVFTSHNYGGFARSRMEFLRLTRRLRHADVLLGHQQHPGINATTSVVIPNGVPVGPPLNTRRAPLPGHPFVFLFLSRLTPEKNADVLIRAAVKLRIRLAANENSTDSSASAMAAARAFEVQIAGDGPQADELHALTAELDAGELVQFLGMRSDIASLHERAHAFVLPSAWEGLPLAVLEAGASSLPVIASPVGALPWILDQERGYLCTTDQLEEQMLSVLNRYDDALIRGQRLYSLVKEEFNDETFVERHVRLYESVLQRD